MVETLPIRTQGRKDDEALHERVARARRAREAAEERVSRRFDEMKPDERRWRACETISLGPAR